MRISRRRLKQIANLLRREYSAQRVILFGSLARGEAGPDSDIDLFITASTTEKFYDRMATVRGLLNNFDPRLPVAPIILTPSETESRLRHGDQFVHEILSTGIEI